MIRVVATNPFDNAIRYAGTGATPTPPPPRHTRDRLNRACREPTTGAGSLRGRPGPALRALLPRRPGPRHARAPGLGLAIVKHVVNACRRDGRGAPVAAAGGLYGSAACFPRMNTRPFTTFRTPLPSTFLFFAHARAHRRLHTRRRSRQRERMNSAKRPFPARWLCSASLPSVLVGRGGSAAAGTDEGVRLDGRGLDRLRYGGRLRSFPAPSRSTARARSAPFTTLAAERFRGSARRQRHGRHRRDRRRLQALLRRRDRHLGRLAPDQRRGGGAGARRGVEFTEFPVAGTGSPWS